MRDDADLTDAEIERQMMALGISIPQNLLLGIREACRKLNRLARTLHKRSPT